MISGFISCSTEEVTEDNVVGVYTNLTDNSNTEITIQQASDHLNLNVYLMITEKETSKVTVGQEHSKIYRLM